MKAAVAVLTVLSVSVTTCLRLCGAALIETQQTVLAAVGEDSLLGCNFIQPEDVLQVTWQKVLPDQEQNMATVHKDLGQRVNPGFRDKLQFKDAGLKNSSIVIRSVVEQDEGCYLCLFNTYPLGAFTGKTCLQLYELHEPILHVRESNRTEESVVSCSATGRPAPTVTLSVTRRELSFSHYDTVNVTNTNATVSVTTTAVLSGFHNNSIQVGCAARVLSGPQKEVFMVIPELKQTSAAGFDEKPDDENRDFRSTISVLALALTCACVLAVITKQKHKSSTQEPSDHSAVGLIILGEEPRTPSVKLENKLRKRTPPSDSRKDANACDQSGEQSVQETPEENQNSENKKPSPKRLNFDHC